MISYNIGLYTGLLINMVIPFFKNNNNKKKPCIWALGSRLRFELILQMNYHFLICKK